MNRDRPLILMVEDDEEVATLNARMLKRKGYSVLLAGTAAQARELAASSKPDLFVLDIGLPDSDGFALCEEIRSGSDAPVLFLTGRKEPEDMVAGIRMGGDYFLTKPYNMSGFIAIVNRLIQKEEHIRSKLEKAVAEISVIKRGSLTLNVALGKAHVGDRDAKLTPREFAVLLMLVQNEDKELTSDAIYESIWGTSMNNDSGALRTQIARLKKKLGEETTDDFAIVFKQGKGYTFTRG